jgi:protein-S-isoprenylcysteine O-methyltransferase Ste14
MQTIYQQIVGVCWIVFLVVWAVLARGGAAGGGRFSARARVLRLGLALVLIIALSYGNRGPRPEFANPTGALAIAGCALCVAGLAFGIWARVSLGRQWGMPMTLRDRPELVTTGPYAFVRHPIYTGIASMMIGTALVQPFSAVVAIVLIPYLLYSARREERDMERLLPDIYPAYKARTKSLVPFLF